MKQNSMKNQAIKMCGDEPSRRKHSLIVAFAHVVVVGLLPILGCHNVDSQVVRQVTWTCLQSASDRPLPLMRDKEGNITPAYKKATSVRFHFVSQPDQYVDLYQPGLCLALQSQDQQVLAMTLGLTRDPSGRLLSFEEVSLPGRSLASSQQTRSSLYLLSDEATISAMDQKNRLRKQNEFPDEEPIPPRRMTVEEFLK